jgi:hypothetical protein
MVQIAKLTMSQFNSPIKVKKARGLAALKYGKPSIDVEDEEFGEQFADIERALNQHRLGTFKLFYKDMTFNWADGDNRKLASEAQIASLKTSMQGGIFRNDLNHRMSGVVEGKRIEKHIFPRKPTDGNDVPSIKLAEVHSMNERAEYPILMFMDPHSIKVEMQSGQHRMAVLRDIKPDMSDHWWLVTIYDSGHNFTVTANFSFTKICKRCLTS